MPDVPYFSRVQLAEWWHGRQGAEYRHPLLVVPAISDGWLTGLRMVAQSEASTRRRDHSLNHALIVMTRFTRNTLVLASILAVTAVLLGAFGAHGLRGEISPDQMQSFRTGVSYQFYHALAMAFVGLLSMHLPGRSLQWPVLAFALGIGLFSGSIYLLSMQPLIGMSLRFLGPITPLGGVLFIVGWVLLIRQLLKVPLRG